MKMFILCLTMLSSIAAYAQVSLEDLKEGDVILYPTAQFNSTDPYYVYHSFVFSQYDEGTVISIGKKYVGWFGDMVVKFKSNSTGKEFSVDMEGLKGIAKTEGCNAGQHCVGDLALYREGFDKINRSHVAGISPNSNGVLVGKYDRGVLFHKWVVPASQKIGDCTLKGDYCVGDEGIFSDSGILVSSDQQERILFSKEKISNAKIVGIFPQSRDDRINGCDTRVIIKTEQRMFNVDLSCQKSYVFLKNDSIADEKCSAYVDHYRFATEKEKEFLEKKLETAGYTIVDEREEATVEADSWIGSSGHCPRYRNCMSANVRVSIKSIKSDFKLERSNTSMYRADPDESITAGFKGKIKIWSKSGEVRELNLVEDAINKMQIGSCHILTSISE